MVAAGLGTRLGVETPKQHMLLAGRSVLDRALDCVAGRASVIVVASDSMVAAVAAAFGHRVSAVVAGGSTRSASVRAGLKAVPSSADVVLVHDAARPFCPSDVVDRVVSAVRAGADAVVPAMAVTDTIKVVDGSAVVSTLDRSSLVAVQTPQGFRAAALRCAHASGGDATDDATLVEGLGGRVEWVAGSPLNRKLTTGHDLEWFETEARRMATAHVVVSDARSEGR